MRFSIEKKFIYLANPKTGSTSIRSLFDKFSDHQLLKSDNCFHEHWTASQYHDVFLSRGLGWDDYFKFTTVRNPWARYVSNYYYSKPDKKGNPFYVQDYDVSSAFRLSFSEWLQKWLVERNRHPHGYVDVKTFTCDSQGHSLVNGVFRVEDFSLHGLPELISRGIVDKDTIIPELNQSKAKNYREHYSDSDAELIATKCKADIEIGSYTIDELFS